MNKKDIDRLLPNTDLLEAYLLEDVNIIINIERKRLAALEIAKQLLETKDEKNSKEQKRRDSYINERHKKARKGFINAKD